MRTHLKAGASDPNNAAPRPTFQCDALGIIGARMCGTCAVGGSWVDNDLLERCGVSLRGNTMMAQSTKDDHPLSGVRVLIVEDDPLMAMDLEDTLAEAGAVVVGLCQTLNEAMARANVDDFVVAVLDFSLGPDTASLVARQLVRRGVPFVLHTGKSSRDPSLAEWACPIIEKPASPRALVSAIRTVLPPKPCLAGGRR
jgi:CheY-like chemotaxis protein